MGPCRAVARVTAGGVCKRKKLLIVSTVRPSIPVVIVAVAGRGNAPCLEKLAIQIAVHPRAGVLLARNGRNPDRAKLEPSTSSVDITRRYTRLVLVRKDVPEASMKQLFRAFRHGSAETIAPAFDEVQATLTTPRFSCINGSFLLAFACMRNASSERGRGGMNLTSSVLVNEI